MIGCDWGTTNLRAFRLEGSRIVDRRTGPGLMATPAGAFASTLHDLVAPWLAAGEGRILLSGMVGSRQGWVEAPYLPCPADPAALAAAAVPVPFPAAAVHLVPGLSDTAGPVPEVMRGEEVQVAGILGTLPATALVCLPGTHSKWVRVEAGRVAGFATHMTGEAFAALRGHTILARLLDADAPHHADAFTCGVDRAGDAGGLLHHLFGVRTLGLFGALPEAEAASYLSGLLIGHEVRAAAPSGPVHLVGAAGLSALYACALRRIGIDAVVEHPDAAARGLARIGAQVAWH